MSHSLSEPKFSQVAVAVLLAAIAFSAPFAWSPQAVALPSAACDDVFCRTAPSDAAPDDIVFGSFFRMEIGIIDPQNLIGVHAALLEQNEKGGIAGRMLRTEVPGPATLTEAQRLGLFMQRSRNYTAILMTSTLLQQQLPALVQASLGRVPIMAPNAGGSPAFFSAQVPLARNLLHVAHGVTQQALHLLNLAMRGPSHSRKLFIVALDTGTSGGLDSLKATAHAAGLPEPTIVFVPILQPAAAWTLVEAALPSMAEIQQHALALKRNRTGTAAPSGETAALFNATAAAIPTSDPDFISAARQLLPHAFFLLSSERVAAPVVNAIMNVDPRLHVIRDEISFFAILLANSHQWRNATNSSEPFKNLYHTQTFPHPRDTRYVAVQQYQAAMRRAFDVYTDPAYHGHPKVPYQRGVFDVDSFGGYLAGRLTIEALLRTPNISAAAIADVVFRTKTFQIGDVVLGPYSSECVGQQTSGTGACWCNVGQRQFFTTRVNATTGLTDYVDNDASRGERDVFTVDIDASRCSFDTALIRRQAHILLPALPGGTATTADSALSFGWTAASLTAAHGTLRQHATARLFAARQQNLGRALEVFPVTLAMDATAAHGVYTPTDAASRYEVRATLGDNAPHKGATPQLRLGTFRFTWPEQDPAVVPFDEWSAQRLAIPAYPVLADLVHTAVAYASSIGAVGNVHVVADTASMAELTRRSVETFGVRELAASTVLEHLAVGQKASGVPSTLMDPTTGPRVVVVCSQHRDVLLRVQALAAAARASSPTATLPTVVVATSEFVVDEARGSVADVSTAGDGLLFVSGLRSYGSSPSAVAAYGDFLSAVVATSLADTETKDIASYAFTLQRLATPTAALGPLDPTPCPAGAVAAGRPARSSCQCSKGINTFHVRPMTHALNATLNAAAPLYTFTNPGCGVTYTTLPTSSSGLSTQEVTMIAAGGVVFLVIVGAAVAFVVFTCCLRPRAASKNAGNAPQDATKPYTMVFTDIQASTVLWAHAPQLMGDALDTHHAILRSLIVDHNGYEVKTIGDSFMVAFKEAKGAVEYAVAVQRELYEHRWGTGLFDSIYQDQLYDAGFIVDQVPEWWHGLRVRVGVHTGIGSIKFDEASGGYDYYGTVVNTAARVEAVGHGGQVLITDDTFSALGGAQVFAAAPSVEDIDSGAALFPPSGRQNIVVASYGPQPLRGLSAAVSLYQVLPSEFHGRRFPPLRLDKDVVIDASSDEGSLGQSSGPSSAVAASANDAPHSGDTSQKAAKYAAGGSSVGATQHVRGAADLPAAVSRMCRRLGLKTPPAGLLFSYRLVETLLSTTAARSRTSLAGDFAGRWRVPQPLPRWARLSAAATQTPGTVAQGGAHEDRTAGQVLFTVARVLHTLEALPVDRRPEWVGGAAPPSFLNGELNTSTLEGRVSKSGSATWSQPPAVESMSAMTPKSASGAQAPGMVSE